MKLSSLLLGTNFMIRILFSCPTIFFQIIWYYIIKNVIFGLKQDVVIQFGQTKLIGPNEHGFFYTAVEVFERKLYNKLTDFNHILDLGGYLGESAVRFAQNNSKVTVVEANAANYTYITKNTKSYKNINSLHGAIVHNQDLQLYYLGNDYSAGGTIVTTPTPQKITNLSIGKVFSSDIDGIKMDIEGGEYDIISYLMPGLLLQIKKGYIEFHDIANHMSII